MYRCASPWTPSVPEHRCRRCRQPVRARAVAHAEPLLLLPHPSADFDTRSDASRRPLSPRRTHARTCRSSGDPATALRHPCGCICICFCCCICICICSLPLEILLLASFTSFRTIAGLMLALAVLYGYCIARAICAASRARIVLVLVSCPLMYLRTFGKRRTSRRRRRPRSQSFRRVARAREVPQLSKTRREASRRPSRRRSPASPCAAEHAALLRPGIHTRSQPPSLPRSILRLLDAGR